MKTLPLKTQFGKLALAFAITIAIISCKKGTGPGASPKSSDNTPTITSVDVTEGSYNTMVEISGTGFDTTNNVAINGKKADIYHATSNKLTVLVPLAAGNGAITINANGKIVNGPNFKYKPALVVTTFAGGLQPGLKDGKGEAAKFDGATDIVADKKGNFYVADSYNRSIRKITADGTVTTMAGNFTQGASNGIFSDPKSITIDAAGNLYVADYGNNLIRKITPSGQVSTFAGNGFRDYKDGTGTSAGFYGPIGITIDAENNLYVVEDDSRLRKITPNGVVTTIAGNGRGDLVNGTGLNAGIGYPNDITIDKDNNLYVLERHSGTVRKITPAAEVSTYVDTKNTEDRTIALAITMDDKGNLYLSDNYFSVRIVKPDKTINKYAGTFVNNTILNGPVQNAMFIDPMGIAFDADNNVYVCDRYFVREVSVQ